MTQKNKSKNSKLGLVCWVVSAVILAIAGTIFIVNELIQNRVSFLRYYQEEQQMKTQQVVEALEVMLHSGMSEEDLVEYLQLHVDSSSSQYPIFAVEDELFYVKDKCTTNMIAREQTWNDYLLDLQEDFIITEVKFTIGRRYTLAIVTHKDSLLNRFKVVKHEIYIFIAYMTTIFILLAISIISVTTIALKNEKIHKYRNRLVVENKKLETVVNELESIREDYAKEAFRSEEKVIGNYYDMDIVNSLLKKSDRSELQPLHLMLIKLDLANIYYSKNKIFDMVQPIFDLMKPKWIMAEVGKGEFVLMLYKTQKSEVELLKEKIYHTGMTKISKECIKVKLGYIQVKNHSSAYDTFYFLRKKMQEDEE